MKGKGQAINLWDDNTSAGVQPIGRNKDVVRPDIVDIPQKLKTGALSAKKYNAA